MDKEKPTITIRFAPSRESSLAGYLRGEVEPEEIIVDGKRVFPSKGSKLNPNCSEVVFELPGLARDEVAAKLREIGIIEITMKKVVDDDGISVTVIADKDNPLIPTAVPEAGNFDIEKWADGWAVHGGMNLGDYAYPTMLKIQQAFPDGKWDDISGSDVGNFLQWYIHGSPPPKTVMDNETRKIREEQVEPAFREMAEPNPGG